MISDNMEKWAWNMACQVYPCNPLDEFGLALRADIAYALIKARSQAFEECAKIAEDHIWATSAISRASDYEAGGSDVAQVISQAIRQHSQKGRES